MGFYVNPQTGTKEAFLNQNGEMIPTPKNYTSVPSSKAIVCLVDNGMFTAAGVIYSEREFADWNNVADTRPKKWYSVDRSKLYEVSTIEADDFE